ncbi:MAG: NAD-dependent dehydratase, partial [Pseudoalteromonas sp.]
PQCTFADISKINKLLDWSPSVKFEDGVKIMFDNIDFWKDAPIWNENSIKEATQVWFDCLGEK